LKLGIKPLSPDHFGVVGYSITKNFDILLIVIDKSISIIYKSDHRNSGYVPGSANDRVALVWPITCEAVSLSKNKA
jgi:hypothetical protein